MGERLVHGHVCVLAAEVLTCQVILGHTHAARADFRFQASDTSDIFVLITDNPFDEFAYVFGVMFITSTQFTFSSDITMLEVVVIGQGSAELFSPIFFGGTHDWGQDITVSEGHAHVSDGWIGVIVICKGVADGCFGQKEEISLSDVDKCIKD